MANVVVTVSLDSTEAEAQLKSIGAKVVKSGKKAGTGFASGFSRSLKSIFAVTVGNVLARGVTNAMAKVSSALVGTVKDAKDLENAFTGLRAVAGAMGQDVSQVSDIAKRLSEDGLIPLADSAAALKNILATGVDAATAEKALLALRDAASFNRQGQLDLGQAIRGATEGIKNQNSIMVDNAGITKNLSVILKEYASGIGRSVASLTDQEKKQAIINGIIKEAALFQGNYNLLLETFSGAQTKAAGQAKFLSAEIGELITKNRAIITLYGQNSSALEALRGFIQANKAAITVYINQGLNILISTFQVVLGLLDNFIKFIRLSAAALTFLGTAMINPTEAMNRFKESFRSISEEGLLQQTSEALEVVKLKMMEASSAAVLFGEKSIEAGNKSKEAAQSVDQAWNFTGVNFKGVATSIGAKSRLAF